MASGGEGKTWADVGLAIVDFARHDPLVFCGVTGFIALILWILAPRARYLRGERLRRRLEDHDRQLDLPLDTKDRKEDADA
ncbi:hypothetical protein [Caenispirillum bisanense]|uniref:hypothetical protein n=1 Tax=Caenispirillum bisanense TaxID=414052 RepID=UPI0031D5DA92